jgi:hypothetical protein
LNADLRVVYLVGEPGVGKSHAMTELTLPYERVHGVGYLRRPRRELLLRDGQVRAVELGARGGKHPPGHPGTDAMSMTAIVEVDAWLDSPQAARDANLILGEGARLGVRRLVDVCGRTGAELVVVHAVGEEQARHRREARGTRQKESWIAGARTRAARFADYARDSGATVVPAGPDDLTGALREVTGL